MDLQLLFRVIWRFRLLVACGLVLAVSLATLSYVRVSFAGKPTLAYRENQQWESLSTLFVTTKGFPWGSAYDPNSQVTLPNGTVQSVPTVNSSRLGGLASLYMEYAKSDPVYRGLLQLGPINGALRTYSVFPGGDTSAPPLPMITLSAVSPNPSAARALNGRWIKALLGYIEAQQTRAKIPSEKRAVLQVIREPERATLLVPRKKTRPIIVFITVMTAFVGLAFILENLRPRVRHSTVEDVPSVHQADVRRSA